MGGREILIIYKIILFYLISAQRIDEWVEISVHRWTTNFI